MKFQCFFYIDNLAFEFLSVALPKYVFQFSPKVSYERDEYAMKHLSYNVLYEINGKKLK